MPDDPKTTERAEHRWSGWPGAWCLDCGQDDPREIALADGVPVEEILARGFTLECKEAGNRRFDPYKGAPRTRADAMRLIAYWREWQNMVASNPMWLPPGMHEAQAASFARANVATGDPNFD